MKHLPTPWTAVVNPANSELPAPNYPASIKGEAYWVADFMRGQPAGITPLANAKFVAKAVNAHEALLSACKRILADFAKGNESIGNYSDGEYTEDYTTRLEMLEKAIAKAEGK